MQPVLKVGPNRNQLLMSCVGTEECKQTILYFMEQRALARLRELLPVIFDKNKVFTTDERVKILRQCSLTPTKDGSQVSFILEQEPLPSPVLPRRRSSSSSPRDRPLTPSASERSWPSSVETESD
jgi:hypothetical protein